MSDNGDGDTRLMDELETIGAAYLAGFGTGWHAAWEYYEDETGECPDGDEMMDTADRELEMYFSNLVGQLAKSIGAIEDTEDE